MTVDTRVFVVGCPRSGTTLTQAMLGAHPDVFTFPESLYFKKLYGRLWRWRKFGIVSPRSARAALARVCTDVDAVVPIPRWTLRARPYGEAFVRVVDSAASARDRRVWVEKSPRHVQCIDVIASVVPNAKFVHVVRDGRDVVRSFLAVCEHTPTWMGQVLGKRERVSLDTSAGRRTLLEAIARRWNNDIAISRALATAPNHHIVRYDALTSDPVATLTALCLHIGVSFHEAMLDHTAMADEVVGRRRNLRHMEAVFTQLNEQPRARAALSADELRVVESVLVERGDLDWLQL